MQRIYRFFWKSSVVKGAGIPVLFLSLVCLACGSDSGDSKPAGLMNRVELTDQAVWVVVDEAQDPFESTRSDIVRCLPDRDMMAEVEFSGFWYTVATRFCNYGTARNTLKQAIPKGATVRARFFHFSVTKGEGEWHIGMALGEPPEVVLERSYAIPAKTLLFDEFFVAKRDYKAGESVFWHIDNHGVNDWSLLTLTAVGPDHACDVSAEVCALQKNCEWYGQCAFDAETCDCVVGSDDHCANSIFCSYYGLCKSKGNACVAKTSAECTASTHCGLDGLCTAVDDECIAATDDDCTATDGCKYSGMCHAAGNSCNATSDEDCKGSESCPYGGQCTEHFGACVALTMDDCAQSEGCSDSDPCVIENLLCVPASGEPRRDER